MPGKIRSWKTADIDVESATTDGLRKRSTKARDCPRDRDASAKEGQGGPRGLRENEHKERRETESRIRIVQHRDEVLIGNRHVLDYLVGAMLDAQGRSNTDVGSSPNTDGQRIGRQDAETEVRTWTSKCKAELRAKHLMDATFKDATY